MYLGQPKNLGAMRWRLILGLLCCALLVFAGTLSVSHGHDDLVTHPDCSLCATAHVSVQPAAALAIGPVVQVFTKVEARIPASRPKTIFHYSLFTRPPPTDALLSL